MALNSAFGNFMFQELTTIETGAGLKLPTGMFIPPGGRVAAYVRSTGQQTGDEQQFAGRIVTTLDQGLRQCRSGMQDIVIVLPGHEETVTTTSFANLVAGTRILGAGSPNQTDAPTFTWGATGATWDIDVANVYISGLALDMTGADGITIGIDVNANGFTLSNCNVLCATDDTLHAVDVINIGAIAGCTIIGNYFHGAAGYAVTGAVIEMETAGLTHVLINGNSFNCAAVAAVGHIAVDENVKFLHILDNVMYNTETSSTACISVADKASDGIVARNMLATLNNGTATAQGIVVTGTTSTIKYFENYSNDQDIKSGILTPTACT